MVKTSSSGGCGSGDDTPAYIYGNAVRCLVAQPQSGLLIQDRERLAAVRPDQAARHGRIGRPGESVGGGLGFLLAGDQEDDAAGAAQRRRRQRHALDEGLELRLGGNREPLGLRQTRRIRKERRDVSVRTESQ